MKNSIIGLLGFLPLMACANPTDNHYIVSLSLGPTWAYVGESQTFYLAPEIEKTYAANKKHTVLAEGEIFLGMQKPCYCQSQAQLGLALAATTPANASGNIWDDADPTFNNYTYHYRIQHSHIALKGKWLAQPMKGFIPWMSASLGVGFNHAYSFNNTPIIFEAVQNPNFASNTQTTITYTLGIGVQKTLNCHWQIGMAYEFSDWGKSQLDVAPGQAFKSGLTLQHLYTNGLLFNFTYLS